MSVMVTLKDGESLKLGIRSSNFKADGTRSTNDSHGWFKVDHFRLQRIDAQEIPSPLLLPQGGENGQWTTDNAIYNLAGQRIKAEANPSMFNVQSSMFNAITVTSIRTRNKNLASCRSMHWNTCDINWWLMPCCHYQNGCH